MEYQFEILAKTRENLVKFIDGFTTEQLNHTPKGFSNNLIWNLAHCVVTQQLLCYKLSGNKMIVSDDFIEKFKKGSIPTEVSKQEISEIRELLLDTPTQMKSDYESGLLKSFDEYPTSYGITLNSVEDAIKFNNTHEGLHLGYCMAMKKSIV